MLKPLTMDHNKLWKILQEMGITDHLTYFLRNLYAVQEWTGSKFGKEYIKVVYCQQTYLTYMQSTSWDVLVLDEAQAEIKTARRNINNLGYADDTTLMAESEEELKSHLMKVKEEIEKSWLKTQHSEN